MDRLEALEIFVAAADEGGFAKAARKLERPPAAVTRAVAELEQRFGVRLFNRTTRAVRLTDAGARYLEQARRTLLEYAALESTVESDLGAARGLITVSAPEMFGRLHVLPIVQRFMQDYTQIEVSMIMVNRLVSFIDEGIDLAVRIAHLPDSRLRAILVGHVHRVCCASPGYLDRRGTPKSFQDLVLHETVAFSNQHAAPRRWSFEIAGVTMAAPIRPRLVLNSVQAVIDAAVADGGIVRLLSYQSAELEKIGLLQRVLDDPPQPPIPIHIVYPDGRNLPPKVRAFMDRATEALRKEFGV